MIERHLTVYLRRSRKSTLILGPRQTGKSTLVGTLAPTMTINFAHEPTFLEFARNPAELDTRLAPLLAREQLSTVFIDEVQRLPGILNTVQYHLDQSPKKLRFLLTGSSARKLRRGQANLLPGRVHTYELGPLVASEIAEEIDLSRALRIGLLPGIFLEEEIRDAEKTLRSYGSTYLREEVQAEALSRNIEGFARFLGVAATVSGSILDLSKLASEAQISRQSAVRYFEILEDTLLVRRIAPFAKSERRRIIQHPRFYFFDVGVWNGVLGNFAVSPDRVGVLFEHFICSQLTAGASARDEMSRLSFFRTEHGAEVDFIFEFQDRQWAIEVKASRNVGRSDLRGLSRFRELIGKKGRTKFVILYTGTAPKVIDGIEILPWQQGLREIGV